ncbi:hypothetical protein TRAPUB_9239 [Trametes pubescens]|uniref:Uncharacterized protein n=1 Tax=Trametes pubescens TaxID=154538 RepID=A0A1M2W2P1_TRAPU|nr:hypothetical protein TRAPUB_9239 [Trametes pubescens]
MVQTARSMRLCGTHLYYADQAGDVQQHGWGTAQQRQRILDSRAHAQPVATVRLQTSKGGESVRRWIEPLADGERCLESAFTE